MHVRGGCGARGAEGISCRLHTLKCCAGLPFTRFTIFNMTAFRSPDSSSDVQIQSTRQTAFVVVAVIVIMAVRLYFGRLPEYDSPNPVVRTLNDVWEARQGHRNLDLLLGLDVDHTIAKLRKGEHFTPEAIYVDTHLESVVNHELAQAIIKVLPL